MPDTIEHIGNIVNIEDKRVFVSIYSKSVCSKCDVRGSCNSLSGTSEKIFEIDVQKNHGYLPGQKVRLSITSRAANKSVLIAYILPLVLLITGMALADSLFHNEGITAVTALVILFLYFTVLSLFKKKLSKLFIVNIEPYDNAIKLLTY